MTLSECVCRNQSINPLHNTQLLFIYLWIHKKNTTRLCSDWLFRFFGLTPNFFLKSLMMLECPRRCIRRKAGVWPLTLSGWPHTDITDTNKPIVSVTAADHGGEEKRKVSRCKWLWFVVVCFFPRRPQWSRIRRFPETILFSSTAPAGISIRSPWLAMMMTVPWWEEKLGFNTLRVLHCFH